MVALRNWLGGSILPGSISGPALVSAEYYLRRKSHCEFLDGVLHPKTNRSEEAVGAFNLLYCCSRTREWRHSAKFPDQIPYPRRHYRFPHSNLPSPPNGVPLYVEILSPDDRIGAMLAKCKQYHDWRSPIAESSIRQANCMAASQGGRSRAPHAHGHAGCQQT